MRAGKKSKIMAVLGPTNTGKTHFALERMMGYNSGVMGFPLRLLARENYDRVVAAKGPSSVALLTGEEKILPPGARYFLCTVESMPHLIDADFVAIDEVQLMSDSERGHIFTDRILHARGHYETLLLGSDNAYPLLQKLIPGLERLSRPRLSSLGYLGYKKLSRLPRKSAVIVFSMTDVYAYAELMRQHRGGAAIVLGALSPRTRNAQVQMFESGEVDYLVATDAIGMGLNLGLDHVAFARTTKFDGRSQRNLRLSELGQIAGRAGRFLRDGTFGTTAGVKGLSADTIEHIENHRYPSIETAGWRNPALDFSSAKALLQSLQVQPPVPWLWRKSDAQDHQSLMYLMRAHQQADKAQGSAMTQLLWQVAQIPDFHKTLPEQHHRFQGQILEKLQNHNGHLPEDWLAGQIRRLDSDKGSSDALMMRLAQVRTWTYISHRSDWLSAAKYWQEKTSDIENRLSDALHEALTQRFVDKRSSALVRGLSRSAAMQAYVNASGHVYANEHIIGQLRGFRFTSIETDNKQTSKLFNQTARHVLGKEIERRIAKLSRLLEKTATNSELSLSEDGLWLWNGEKIARLQRGLTALDPEIEILDSDLLTAEQIRHIQNLGKIWIKAYIQHAFAPLFSLPYLNFAKNSPARGVAFQLWEGMGFLPRHWCQNLITSLTKADRQLLLGSGLVIGWQSLYFPSLLQKKPRALAYLLSSVFNSFPVQPDWSWKKSFLICQTLQEVDFLKRLGWIDISVAKKKKTPSGFLLIRADVLEKIALWASRECKKGPFTPSNKQQNLLKVDALVFHHGLVFLGYQPVPQGNSLTYEKKTRTPRANDKPKQHQNAETKSDTPTLDAPLPSTLSGDEIKKAHPKGRKQLSRNPHKNTKKPAKDQGLAKPFEDLKELLQDS